MNIAQRVVLVVGAVVLIAAILTTPNVVIVQGSYSRPSALPDQLLPMITPATAFLRAVGVIGATLLVFFSLQGIKFKKKVR